MWRGKEDAMARYVVDVAGNKVKIEAASALEAAKKAVSADAFKSQWTVFYKVLVRPAAEPSAAWETYTVAADPPVPPCVDGHEHKWLVPKGGGGTVLPDVHAYNGAVIIRLVCRYCARYRITDPWPQDPCDTPGLTEIRYIEADERSRRWVESLKLKDEGDDE
jgi:hypothetical protein